MSIEISWSLFCNNAGTDLKLSGDGADFSAAMDNVFYLI